MLPSTPRSFLDAECRCRRFARSVCIPCPIAGRRHGPSPIPNAAAGPNGRGGILPIVAAAAASTTAGSSCGGGSGGGSSSGGGFRQSLQSHHSGCGGGGAAAATRMRVALPRVAAGGGGGGCSAASAAASDDVTAAAPRVEEPSTALLLAWFACGNRSLFAAQCLVEVLVELYREGRTFGELQLTLKMATQNLSSSSSNSRARGRSSGSDAAWGEEAEGEEVVVPPLLQGQEEDVLVSWVALVFLTLEELGLRRDRDPATGEQPEQQQQQQQAQREQAGLRSAASAPVPTAEGERDGFGADMGLGAGNSSSGSSSSMAAGNTYLRGMLGYVRQTLGMYDEGQTLARVAGLQGLVQQSSSGAGGSSPFLVLMQQYTRLVLLTVEVVAAAGLPTVRPLRPPETVLQPSGYSQAFISTCNATLGLDDNDGGRGGDGGTVGPGLAVRQQQKQQDQEPCPARGLAVRLLMAFIGAVLGSQWSLVKFVDAVRVAYDQGLAADELFFQLDEQEFVQSGGLLPIAGTPAPPSPGAPPAATATAAGAGSDAVPPPTPPTMPAPQYQITKALLSTWISLSYMTMAQLAVPYPAAGQRLGWAWAGFGDPIEALGMNDFVGNVLRQMAGEDPRVVPLPDQPPQPLQPQAGTSGPDQSWTAAAASITTSEPGLQTLDPDVDPGSGTGVANVGAGNRRRDGALMVRVEDESLPATSTAVRVLTQQVALVQAVCRQVMTDP